jgi:hypothetical protein
MRKILLIALAAILLQSCTEKAESGGHSEKAKKNSESMNGIIRAIESRDLSKLDQYMAADIVDHAAMGGPTRGIEGVKADLEQQMQFTSGTKIEVLKELADDEYVMSWLRFRGTITQDYMGMKKGDSMTATAIELGRFNDEGKAVEHWTFMEPGEMMKMMGGSQPPADSANAAKPDSTGGK